MDDAAGTHASIRRLGRRRAVRLARAASRESGVAVLLVGGAVRDTLLGLPPGDLDLAVAREGAPRFAAELARLAGTRVLAIGREPRRILHVPLGATSVDVWETAGDPEDDLLRRDFAVNALAVAYPGARLVAPPGALEDLHARRLRLPRAGVLLEDPLRVVRAARFLARLPRFRLDPATLPELRRAAPRLADVAPERRLAELDGILAAGPRRAAAALRRLERWGALASLLPGVEAAERRRGVTLVGRAGDDARPALLRTLLLEPAKSRAVVVLEALRASRLDRRLAAVLFALPRPPRAPSRRDAVLLLRAASPFAREAVAFVAAARGARGRALALEARKLLASRGALARALRPRRPLSAEEVSRLLTATGPALGAALARLDAALATGDVRGRAEALSFLRRGDRPALRAARTATGTV